MKLIFGIFKSLRLIISILISINSSELFSQVLLRPTFKQIEYLIYDLNSPRTKIKDQIVIQTYVKIDQSGKMYIVDRNKELPKYYSYQLCSEEIDILNKAFNGENKLKKLVKNLKLDENVFYSGYYRFLKYIDLNNKPDQISFIESDNINKIKEALAIIISKSSSYDNNEMLKELEFEIDKLFIDEAFENHLKNKRLPEIALPPPPMK